MNYILFISERIIVSLLNPLIVILAIGFCGLILLYFKKHYKLSIILITISFTILLLLSFSDISKYIILPLERKYPLFDPDKISTTEKAEIKWVIVLSGGLISDPELPITSQLNGSSLDRVVEGIRIQKKIPHSKLIMMGGKYFNPIALAEAMGELAKQMGVPDSCIIIESKSMETIEQAELAKQFVGNDKFVLVSSAFHIPRSVALMKKIGLQPIPAPAHHFIKHPQSKEMIPFPLPNAYSLYHTQVAIYEYFSIAGMWIKGKI